jgi:Xaa-Pro aminopeptidase
MLVRRKVRGAVSLALALALLPAGVAVAGTGTLEAATTDELPPAVFAARRAKLVAALGADAVAVLAAPPSSVRNGDNDYPYRTGSDFWYLTGFAEEEAVAVIETRDGKPHCTLFVPPRNPRQEMWTGRRLGTEGARPLAEEVVDLERRGGVGAKLKELLHGRKRVLAQFERNDARRTGVKEAVDAGVEVDEKELREAVGRLRRIKGPEEIALLQRAIDNTCEAERQAMRFCRPGMHEYELQAVIEYCFTALGSPRLGFDSIVGSGRNSVILHYMSNRDVIPSGKTIVCDIGAEYGFYSADVTRTLPSDGKFTTECAAVYRAVLDAQKAGIAKAKPGGTLGAIQAAAVRELAKRLIELGVVAPGGENLAASLLPHGTCHWLGLDTHDECPYDGKLEPGMVTTVEPGCYIPAGTAGIDAKFWDVGVRIEDDVLITEDGNVVLSAGAPREVEEIEALMAQGSDFPRLEPPGTPSAAPVAAPPKKSF